MGLQDEAGRPGATGEMIEEEDDVSQGRKMKGKVHGWELMYAPVVVKVFILVPKPLVL